MQIDRSKFFALTTAISTAVIAAMSGAAGCSSTATTTTDGGASPDGSTTDSGTTDASNTDGGDGGDAGACLGTTGMATCSAEGLTNGPACGPICSTALENYTAGVAAEIAPCILSLPTCEGSEAAVVDCHAKAVAKACADSTVQAYCQGLATTCGDAGTSDLLAKCEAFAPALSTDGRAAFTSCVTESGCFQSITSCIEGLEGSPL